jgi:hydrogenase expression/formation protein HypD
MKFLDEFRDPNLVQRVTLELKRIATRPWTLMEVCGGQTHSIVKHGLDRLLPEGVTLVHGPGCPVCVTPSHLIDQAITLAETPNLILTSFGDMLRVPGSGRNLWSVKSTGGDVRVVYSPRDALALARTTPDREVVFFAVGFETTAPAVAQAVLEAAQEKIKTFRSWPPTSWSPRPWSRCSNRPKTACKAFWRRAMCAP